MSILFLDIETIPQHPSFDTCPEEVKKLWARKAANLKHEPEESVEDLYKRAGIYAEFGQIICISTGFVHKVNDIETLRIKSFYGHDEQALLSEFGDLLRNRFSSTDSRLCAHNGKEFDFPFLARRMVINGVPLPGILDIAGKKPWEVNFLDTMEMWKFGDFKSYTPLNLLTHVLGVPSPKDDIDGSQVWSVYWIEKDLERIMRYCEKDVEALANVYRRMRGLKIIPREHVVRA